MRVEWLGKFRWAQVVLARVRLAGLEQGEMERDWALSVAWGEKVLRMYGAPRS